VKSKPEDGQSQTHSKQEHEPWFGALGVVPLDQLRGLKEYRLNGVQREVAPFVPS